MFSMYTHANTHRHSKQDTGDKFMLEYLKWLFQDEKWE